MKRLVWAGGILVYILFLIAMAPATVFFRIFDDHGHYRIMTENASGTIWHGTAQSLMVKFPDRPALSIGEASWSLNPIVLLSGRLSADLKFSGNLNGRTQIVLDTNSIRFQQTDLGFPAAFLAYIEPGLNLYPLQGVLQARSHDFLLRTDDYLGQAELTWTQAAMVLSKPQPLGQYQFSVTANGKNIQFQLHSKQDNLFNLDGSGNWSRKSGFSFKGSAAALASEPELTKLLDVMGQKQPDGSYAIHYMRSGSN